MSVFSLRETEMGEKDGEIEHLRHDLQQAQVRAYICIFLLIQLPVCNILAADISRGKGYPGNQLQHAER